MQNERMATCGGLRESVFGKELEVIFYDCRDTQNMGNTGSETRIANGQDDAFELEKFCFPRTEQADYKKAHMEKTCQGVSIK